MTRRLVPWFVALALGGGFAIAYLGACSGQSEGERCDLHADNNGTDDCAGSLICTPSGQLNGSADTDRCCPADRTTATTLVCQVPSTGGIDAAPPSDGAPPAEAGPDTGGDAPSSDASDSGSPDTGASDAPAG